MSQQITVKQAYEKNLHTTQQLQYQGKRVRGIYSTPYKSRFDLYLECGKTVAVDDATPLDVVGDKLSE